MKLLTPILVVLLVISVAANVMLYPRAVGARTQLTVNDEKISKKMQELYLSDRFGTEALAQLAKYTVVRQAAQKANVQADKAEVAELMTTLMETNPQQALMFKRMAHKKFDAEQEMEFQLNLIGLSTKDVRASEDEIKEHFDNNKGKWDKPTKMHIWVMQCRDEATANKTKQLMEKVSDMSIVQQQIDPKGITARMLGADGSMVVMKPFGKSATNPTAKLVDQMKENEVRSVKAQQGIWVVKRGKTDEGKAVSYDEVKKKVERDFKSTRALPAKEVLRSIWDASKIVADDPNMAKQLKFLIFQDPVE